jgi:hypothetical protein
VIDIVFRPLFEGHVLEENLATLRSFEDEDVDFAEALDHALPHRAYCSGISDVGEENLGVATRRANLIHDGFGVFARAQRVDRNGCAGRSKRNRDGASDIPAPPVTSATWPASSRPSAGKPCTAMHASSG